MTDNFDFLENNTSDMLEEMFEGVYILDVNRKIVFWNKGAEQISGFKKSQMIGIHCNEGPLRHEDETHCRLCSKKCPAIYVMENDIEERTIVYMHNSEGEAIPIETNLRALKNNRGEIIGAIEVFRDIRHWKKMENLSEEKDRLMGILAHDIRNPLAVIQGYSTFLIRNDNQAVKAIGETMQSRSKYALALVNDLLDAQTIESGEVAVTIEEIDVTLLVRQAIANYSEVAKAKDIELVMSVYADNPKLYIDAIRLEEVLNNLISNAINYSHKNTKVEIIIDEYDSGILFKISDQGVGIKPDDLEKLFKAFGKTTNRTTAGESSHGLGLYIVKKIIDLFSGTIEVESTPGKGTTFSINFPYGGCSIGDNN